MARSEAQKAADKKYAKKIQGKYEQFVVNFKPDELAEINAAIAASGMTKAGFIRWAVGELKDLKIENI